MTFKQFAKLFDHTNLKADATTKDFEKLCKEAKENDFAMVAVNSYAVEICKDFLQKTDVHVGAAIGFPLGQTTIKSKYFEALDSINNGADEIDYVLNVGKLKEKDYKYIKNEMRTIVELCRTFNVISKVIFENCYLTQEEIRAAAEISLEIRPDFIKTSTGFGSYGARIEDVKIMKEVVGNAVKVKASGGVRDLQTALEMVKIGVERIGTSSSVKIIEEYRQKFGENDCF